MQPITRIRYNHDYELLINEITDYNNTFTCYEDVLLYVNMLDGDWRLPYPAAFGEQHQAAATSCC